MAKKEVIDGHGVVLDQKELDYLRSKQSGREFEYPDPTPVAPPVGYVRQPSLFDLQRDALRRAAEELSRAAAERDFDTLEDCDDFEVGDDDEVVSGPYELDAEYIPLAERKRMQAVDDALAKSSAEERRRLWLEQQGWASEAGGGGAQPPSGQPTSEAPKPSDQGGDAAPR